jgi:hypothetical protein
MAAMGVDHDHAQHLYKYQVCPIAEILYYVDVTHKDSPFPCGLIRTLHSFGIHESDIDTFGTSSGVTTTVIRTQTQNVEGFLSSHLRKDESKPKLA